MTDRSEAEIDRERHVECRDCGEFEMSKTYRGAAETPGRDEYDAIDLPDECPVCGSDLVITMTDGGRVEDDGEIDHLDVPEFNNPAFRGAWEKGARAAVRGEPRDACPYDRDQYGRQGVTFARAFWNRWTDGYEAAEEVDRRD